jgi:hypothetical protein
MDYLNFDDYVRENPDHKEIEFKIFELKDREGVKYYINFLKKKKRLFRKPTFIWVTICYADGHSQGYSWSVKFFDTNQDAEAFVTKICQIEEDTETSHFVKTIK